MKKFNTALILFNSKFPLSEVVSIKRLSKNSFEVTDKDSRYPYSVNISTNKVSIAYPDPEY